MRLLPSVCVLLVLTACPENPPAASGEAPGATPDAVGRTVDDAATAPAGKRPEDARWELGEGEGVTISGTLGYAGARTGAVRMDFVTQEGNQPPNLVHAASIKALGEFSVQAPKDFGKVHIDAFIDVAGDGPSGDDPSAAVSLEVGAEPIAGLAIELSDTPDLGALTPGADPPPPEAPPEGAPGAGAAPPAGEAAAGSAGSGDAPAGAAAGG